MPVQATKAMDNMLVMSANVGSMVLHAAANDNAHAKAATRPNGKFVVDLGYHAAINSSRGNMSALMPQAQAADDHDAIAEILSLVVPSHPCIRPPSTAAT